MAVEVLSSRFYVNEKFNANKNMNVNTLILKNDQTEILLDVFYEFLEIKENDPVDLILYRDNVDDNDVSKDFEYVMNGKMYQKDEKYVGSFGGLRFEMTNSENIDLDDRCFIAIALKRL